MTLKIKVINGRDLTTKQMVLRQIVLNICLMLTNVFIKRSNIATKESILQDLTGFEI